MIEYSRLWETNPLNKLSTSLFFLVRASKSGTRGGVQPYAAQSVSLLQSDSTELKNPISALQVSDKLHRILMLMCFGIFPQPTMQLGELRRTQCCFFQGVFTSNHSWKDEITELRKCCEDSRHLVCGQRVQAGKNQLVSFANPQLISTDGLRAQRKRWKISSKVIVSPIKRW